MRTEKQTEFLMVKHFLANNALNSGDALAVYEQLVTNRQFRSSMMMVLYIFMCGITTMFGFFIIGAPPISTAVEWSAVFIALSLFITFAIRASLKYRRMRKLHDKNSTLIDTVEMLHNVIFSFVCSFGARPEKLGPRGVAIRLTSVAKKIFEYKKASDEYSADVEREILKIKYDTAQVLLPVNTYPDIFDAAEEGKEAPEWIADFAK